MTSRLLALSLALALLPSVARAAVPSPAASTFPPCLVSCPLGDIPFEVTVRDLAYLPVAGATVVLDFFGCPNAFVCSGGSPDPYLYDPSSRTVRMTTGANGRVTFPLRIGGLCASGGVRLYADGILFASYALASPDQDGDGYVVSIIGADDPTFAGKLGTTDPTADFDCDGEVGVTDEQIFYYHHSQSCLGWVDPVSRTSWGRLKLHYR